MDNYFNLIFSVNFFIESLKVIFYISGIIAFVKYITKK